MNQSTTEQEKEKKKREKKLKELYTRYNQCRDLELDRFWKNSVFVWVFLAMCFTTFGILVKDYNMPTKAMNINHISKDFYYLSLSIVSSIGFILSWIWVWMARGLKAWYEVYENAIWEIESSKNEFKYPHQYTINNYWCMKESKCFIQKWLFDPKPFSPSKIVILIGWLLISIWLFALAISLYKYLTIERCTCNCGCIHIQFWWSVIIIVLIILILCVNRWLLKSSTLRDREHNEIYKKIRNDIDNKFFSDSNTNTNNEDCYNLYFEVKKDEVSFSFRNKNGFEIGRRLIIDYYKSVPIDTNMINYSVTFDYNAIDDFYYKRHKSVAIKNDIKRLFENMELSNANIEINGHNLLMHFSKDYYQLHKYMISSCIDELIQKYDSQFINFKVIIN